MFKYIFILLASSLLLSACDSTSEKPTKSQPLKEASLVVKSKQLTNSQQQPLTVVADLMNQSVQLQRFETVAEAMTIWRQFSEQKPTLLLLSGSPALTRAPQELSQKIDDLAHNGNFEDIRQASSKSNSAPLMQSSMAIDIALRNQWFNRLNWIMPMRDQKLAPDQERIRTQFLERRMLNEQEGNSLILDGQVMKGIIRNTTFTASNISQLTQPDKPVIVHIDLGYFQSLYKNEIATPLLQTIYQTVTTLKEKHIQTLAVTFSYNHLDSGIALDVRFVGEILSMLFNQPERLLEPVPVNWQRQADSIYLSNFFQNEDVDKLHKAQEQDDPDSAWIKFSLYRAAAEQKQGDQALAYLAEAVERDSMYAFEYGNLARLAYEKKRPDEAMRMFTLASKMFPDDPFIKLRIAELAVQTGEIKAALHLIDQLQSLQWSEIYYPRMPEFLNEFKTSLNSEE